MPVTEQEFERRPNGSFKTTGLTANDFNKLFNLVAKKQRATRRKGKRQLTKGLLRNKNLEDILKLGKKKDGTFFTPDDLKAFQKRRDVIKRTLGHETTGITYNQLIAHSLPIDVKRANNKVDDGSGISSAAFVGMKNDTLVVSVTASRVSVHQHHRVEIKLEEWRDAQDNLTDDKKKNAKVIANLCAGRVSVNCDCGRWQFWYRYVATVGNYALKPFEHVFPKIRNPKLAGVACKHIIHALTRLQSGTWQVAVARQLDKSTNVIGFGDDKKRTTKFFSEKEIKKLSRNRKAQTNQAEARKAYLKYKKSQRAFTNRIEKTSDELEMMRSQLNRQRKTIQGKTAKIRQQQQENKRLQKIIDSFSQSVQDGLALQRQTFMDALVMTGKTPEDAAKAWLEYFNAKIKGK